MRPNATTNTREEMFNTADGRATSNKQHGRGVPFCPFLIRNSRFLIPYSCSTFALGICRYSSPSPSEFPLARLLLSPLRLSRPPQGLNQ